MLVSFFPCYTPIDHPYHLLLLFGTPLAVAVVVTAAAILPRYARASVRAVVKTVELKRDKPYHSRRAYK